MNIAQPIDSTEKQKITAEPKGATNIFYFPGETNMLHTIPRFYIWIRDQII